MNMKPDTEQSLISIKTTRQDHRIAWLTALAITIHIAESVFPSPLPGVKPGLANVITIAVLMLYGWSTAVWVSLLRVLVGSILIGTFLTPTFTLSLAGAVSSILVLGLATLLPGRGLGPVGYSLLAAQAHMAGQFPHEGLFGLLPLLMTMAVVFGLVSGLIVMAMLPRLDGKTS